MLPDFKVFGEGFQCSGLDGFRHFFVFCGDGAGCGFDETPVPGLDSPVTYRRVRDHFELRCVAPDLLRQ